MSVPIALLTITTALSAMMLAIVWSLRRCGLPGVGEWCNANLTATAALVLFSLRSMIPDPLSVGVANAALRNGQLLDLAGAGLTEVSRTVNSAGQTVRRVTDSSGQLIEIVTDSANRIVSSRAIRQ